MNNYDDGADKVADDMKIVVNLYEIIKQSDRKRGERIANG